MHKICKSKNGGFGDGTLIAILTKKVFQDGYINSDLEIIWNEMNIQNKDVLIRNIYVTPGKENQLKILDKELERHRGKNSNYQETSIVEVTHGIKACNNKTELESYWRMYKQKRTLHNHRITIRFPKIKQNWKKYNRFDFAQVFEK